MKDIVGRSLGRYHIIELLGEGGMSAVYRAFDTGLERVVAIKVIKIERSYDAAFIKRFEREAKTLAHLEHPYILKVLDYGEEDGRPFLVMPYEPGGTLKDRLGVPIPYQEAARLILPIARALEYAHSEGLAHRDIKPANILLSKTGEPILADFGIVKILEAGGVSQLTDTGQGIGTPEYMAPEQWLGEADVSSDIYSLGVVLFEMFSGRRPFIADSPAKLFLKHRNDPLPELSEFLQNAPQELEWVAAKALAKKPEERYPSMSDFVSDLQSLSYNRLSQIKKSILEKQADSARTASLVSRFYPVRQGNWRETALALTVTGIGLLMCVAIAGLYWFTRSANAKQDKWQSVNTTYSPTLVQGSEEVAEVEQSGMIPTIISGAQDTVFPIEPTESITIPYDVPLYPDNEGDLVMETDEKFNNYIFTSRQKRQVIEDFYHDELISDGWVLSMTSKMPNDESFILYVFIKDTFFLSITYTRAEEKTKVVLAFEKDQ